MEKYDVPILIITSDAEENEIAFANDFKKFADRVMYPVKLAEIWFEEEMLEALKDYRIKHKKDIDDVLEP